MQENRLTISWTPGCDSPDFTFNSHDDARAFVMQFLAATQLWCKNNRPEEYKGDHLTRRLANGEIVPENYIRGWIYIDNMPDFFIERRKKFRISLTMVGSNHNLDITALLASVIQFGSAITADQFNFKYPVDPITTKEKAEQRIDHAISIVNNSRNNPYITFDFEDPSELEWMFGKDKAPRVRAAIDALHQNDRNRHNFFEAASAPAAEIVHSLQPTLEQAKLSVMTELVPQLTALVMSAKDVEAVLQLQRHLYRAIRLYNEASASQAANVHSEPMDIDPYQAPPGSHSSL